MEEFLKNLNSFYWWVSVVVVGLLINIFSSYFRDGIDKILSKVSSWWSARSLKRKAETDLLIESLKRDQTKFVNLQLSDIRDRLRIILIFLTSIIFVITTIFLRVYLFNREYLITANFIRWMALPFGIICLSLLFANFSRLTRNQFIISEVFRDK